MKRQEKELLVTTRFRKLYCLRNEGATGPCATNTNGEPAGSRVPSARVTKFVKELSKPSNLYHPLPLGRAVGYILAGDFTDIQERKREPFWRQRDNISELGEGLVLAGEEKKNSSVGISKERPREPLVYTETGFVSAASAIKRDGEGENEGDREKEARNATAFTTSAFTCYVKFRWDPRYTTRRNGWRSLARYARLPAHSHLNESPDDFCHGRS